MKITDAELKIMKILWENERLTLNQIIQKLSTEETKNKSTVKTLLYRLIDKGAVETIEKGRKENEFKANISKKKYLKEENNIFLDKLYNGNVDNMLLNFVEDKKISKEEIKKLLDILN